MLFDRFRPVFPMVKNPDARERAGKDRLPCPANLSLAVYFAPGGKSPAKSRMLKPGSDLRFTDGVTPVVQASVGQRANDHG